MWQRARTLLTHCKHTHTKQKSHTHIVEGTQSNLMWIRVCGTDLLYSNISRRQISIRGNVRLIKMNVRWSKRRVKTSKRSAGSWINPGLNSLQTHLRQEFDWPLPRIWKSFSLEVEKRKNILLLLLNLVFWYMNYLISLWILLLIARANNSQCHVAEKAKLELN